MQAKEKYPQHNVSNLKENIPSSNNSDGPYLKKKVCKQTHNDHVTEPDTRP
jgi:hypothetical protein